MHRTIGGIVAGALFVIPSIFILLALSYIYAAYGNIPTVEGVLNGFKPVVVAIVVEALMKIGGRALKGRAHFVIAAAAFIGIYFLHIAFPLIVLAAALVGWLGALYFPGTFTISAAKVQTSKAVNETEKAFSIKEELPLVIQDDQPPPAHTLPSRFRALRTIAVGLILWLLPFVVLIALRGWSSLHAQEYRFFTQAAFVTFGGAYAVLAYVAQAAPSYGWLSAGQAVDGLALAETTPGPLIMVLQFIGFMAAWNNPEGLNQTTSAIIGALVTTYATFLPCFIFIFLGAPYIEHLRGNRNLTGALSGITAAIVGVILNLALVFGAAVVLPNGFSGNINWFALVLSVSSFAALYKFKVNVLWVVLVGGLIGLLRSLIA
jgi:chromate transporter